MTYYTSRQWSIAIDQHKVIEAPPAWRNSAGTAQAECVLRK
jgi:hypothetical protein